MINNYKRDTEIYKAWKAGKNFSQLAREYGLTPTRIQSICKREEFGVNNPDHICIILEKHYPEVDRRTIRGTVNPILKYFAYKPENLGRKPKKATKEYFFNCLDQLSDDELISLRCIGTRKVLFIEKIKSDRLNGLI